MHPVKVHNHNSVSWYHRAPNKLHILSVKSILNRKIGCKTVLIYFFGCLIEVIKEAYVFPGWLSAEPLQIAEKRRGAKGKGEKERYIHLNAEFQRIARREKKAFLSEQCQEIGGNNSMGKTRDLLKKIRDTKGKFHTKMGKIKDRSSKDLTKAEDIKKRWQVYTEELCRERSL